MSPAPSASRLAGDDYQHLHTWFEALKLLRPSRCVELVRLEVTGAGVVDDLIVKCRDEPAVYQQIKFGTTDQSPIGHDWFLTPLKPGQDAPLKRFYDSWRDLSTPEHPAELALVTNRSRAADDPLLKLVSGRDDTLHLAFDKSERSNAGKVLKGWADALGISRAELHTFLGHLSIRTAESSTRRMLEGCQTLMDFAGLCWDDAALDCAVIEVRRMVQDGVTDIDLATMEAILKRDVFKKVTPQATLAVEAIDYWPNADLADAAVDWVDRFEGDTPKVRRQVKDPALWNDTFLPEIRHAVAQIEAKGYRSVRLVGAMRLATFFVVGEAMPRTRGMEIVYAFHGSDWTTATETQSFPTELTEHPVGQGKGVAIAVSLTHDITDDVLEYLRDAGTPVDRLINFQPQDSPGQFAMPGHEAAMSLAREVAKTTQKAKADRADGVHVFIAGPGAVALFLGHSWNRIPTTHLYDDLNPGYAPTFTIEG